MELWLRCAAVTLLGGSLIPGWSTPPDSDPAAENVVAQMVTHNRERAQALLGYTDVRRYHVEFTGIKKESADEEVRMEYTAPGAKSYTVLSQSGSGFLLNHVVEPMLKAEVESAIPENHIRSAISPLNYSFRLVDSPHLPEEPNYVLEATPLNGNKYLFRGQISVNPDVFAVTKVEGEPAHNPSWWITHADFTYTNRPVTTFWLPSETRSTAHIRFLGDAALTVEYLRYGSIEAAQ